MENTPLVSIVTIAYNLEKYLAEAIESVLMQNVNFSYELVIGEDCSKDNTLQIAMDYQSRYPDRIRVLKREKNLGLTPNCVDTHNHCRGKYIALLDGDDYWTDKNKLQKQVDFMESHPEYAGCAHQSSIIRGDASNFVKLFGPEDDRELHLNDMITHRKFHTSSLLYRREIWVKCGGIPSGISSNERAIYPMLAIFGPVHYMKDNMCVYRLAPTGLNSKISCKELETDLLMLPWLKEIDKNFPIARFRSFLHLCMFTYPKKTPFFKLTRHWIAFVWFSFSYFPKNLGDVKWGTIDYFRKMKAR
ncbi:MAG: glycosyltransferase family 2 protein [Bacteroidales bacterium]|nr:glycosyltransferase family 2 protein [Bacteroidales bacterium]